MSLEELDGFRQHLDESNESPVVEGCRVAPSAALQSNPQRFADAFVAWSGTEEEIEVPPLGEATIRDEDFDAYVNGERPKGWLIDDFRIAAADALATDPDQYALAVRRWRTRRWLEQDSLITEQFPAPIALRFGRFLANNDPARKLAWLLSSWEAAAIVFTSLTLCEIRGAGIDATGCPIRPADHLKGFWNFRTVTELLTALIEYGVDAPTLSQLRNRVRFLRDLGQAGNIVDDIDAVRNPRNDGAHLEPMNDPQARARIALYERPFRERVLEHLDSLKTLTLFSFERDADEFLETEDEPEEEVHRIEVWTYRGLITEKRANQIEDLSSTERIAILGRREPMRDVYARIDHGAPILLSPLITCVDCKEGHGRYLAYLAQVNGERGSRSFEYVTFGDSQRPQLRSSQLERDLEALHQCFRGRNAASPNQPSKQAAVARTPVRNSRRSASKKRA